MALEQSAERLKVLHLTDSRRDPLLASFVGHVYPPNIWNNPGRSMRPNVAKSN